MLRLALIFGGRSAEHEVSLVSARFVPAMLDPAKFSVFPVGITPAAAGSCRGPRRRHRATGWQASSATPSPCSPTRPPGLELADGTSTPLDCAFPCFTALGEDGTIQGLFELAGLPTRAPVSWPAPSAWTRSS